MLKQCTIARHVRLAAGRADGRLALDAPVGPNGGAVTTGVNGMSILYPAADRRDGQGPSVAYP